MYRNYLKVAWRSLVRNRFITVVNIFGLSILVACLGLSGLAMLSVQARIREIGIRKVLGANIRGNVTLLTREIMIIVTISAAISIPLAWWYMNDWLASFIYRISIPWSIFLISSGAACLVAFLTTSILTIKAAATNPVKPLRTG
jgi:putative ABC transport system permease protein